MILDEKKSTAAQWFKDLRDDICGRFEAIERDMGSDASFERKAWEREGGGAGVMSLMKGKVFEKVGVNISTVHGEFSEAFRKEIPGAAEDPRFWASGISLVAHMASPLVPAAHFNTRMIVVGDGNALWFGGGGDLNPMVEVPQDTADFHAAFKIVCDALDQKTSAGARVSHQPAELRAGLAGEAMPEANQSSEGFYEAFRKWCDEYFFIPHRNEARGVGGIFYDYLGRNTLGKTPIAFNANQFGKGGLNKEATARGMDIAAAAPLDWNGAFSFTQEVGRAFATIYPELIRRHMRESWTPEQREWQLVKRGRYAEYNLLYDRGTRFGLMTGGNAEAILMSLPPEAKWP